MTARTPVWAGAVLLVTAAAVLFVSCGRSGGRRVVVFCALDQVFSEPLLNDFEARTGIKVLAKYDTEATKTIALANRLLVEHRSGFVTADVFWNNEILHTIRLMKAGALTPYRSPQAEGMPERFKDPAGHWTGFAARARVIIYNRKLLPGTDLPTGLGDFGLRRWKGMATVARPLAGTTATHGAALFVTMGDEKARTLFASMLDNDVLITLGNATVRDFVVAGEKHFGLTDTDDVAVAIARGDDVGMIFPDQDGTGTLIIPNTVSMLAGCPNSDEAKALIDFLLSAEVEERLAKGSSAQIPLRPGVPGGDIVPALDRIKAAPVDWVQVADRFDEVTEYLKKNFRR